MSFMTAVRDGYLDGWYNLAVRTAPTSLTFVRKGPANDVALAKPSNIVQVTMSCIFATAFQFAHPMANECSKTGLTVFLE
jgi:hypothetical protein